MATKTKEKTPSPPVEYASAMDKLRDEMAKSQGKYVQVVGEYMTAYLLAHPEAEAAILTEGKTIAGSLKVMEAEARKVKTGNVAVLDDQTAFGIVLQYYGLKGTGNSPKGLASRREQGTGIAGQANETPDSVEAPALTEEAHVTAAAPDPFDLDALLGVI